VGEDSRVKARASDRPIIGLASQGQRREGAAWGERASRRSGASGFLHCAGLLLKPRPVDFVERQPDSAFACKTLDNCS
jgi:hypothetical protein